MTAVPAISMSLAVVEDVVHLGGGDHLELLQRPQVGGHGLERADRLRLNQHVGRLFARHFRRGRALLGQKEAAKRGKGEQTTF